MEKGESKYTSVETEMYEIQELDRGMWQHQNKSKESK